MSASMNLDNNLPGLITQREYAILQFTAATLILLVASLGVLTNFLNIKTFRACGLSDGIHVCFMGLSISDLIASLLAIAFGISLMFHAREALLEDDSYFTYDPLYFYYFFINSCKVAYMVTLLTTVYIAIARCMCVVYPFGFKHAFTKKRSFILIICFWVFTLAMFTPVFVSQSFKKTHVPPRNSTRYNLHFTSNREEIKDNIFIVMQTIIPVTAEITVIVCVIVLVSRLHQASKSRRRPSKRLPTAGSSGSFSTEPDTQSPQHNGTNQESGSSKLESNGQGGSGGETVDSAVSCRQADGDGTCAPSHQAIFSIQITNTLEKTEYVSPYTPGNLFSSSVNRSNNASGKVQREKGTISSQQRSAKVETCYEPSEQFIESIDGISLSIDNLNEVLRQALPTPESSHVETSLEDVGDSSTASNLQATVSETESALSPQSHMKINPPNELSEVDREGTTTKPLTPNKDTSGNSQPCDNSDGDTVGITFEASSPQHQTPGQPQELSRPNHTSNELREQSPQHQAPTQPQELSPQAEIATTMSPHTTPEPTSPQQQQKTQSQQQTEVASTAAARNKNKLNSKERQVVHQVILISIIFVVFNTPMILLGLLGPLWPNLDANWGQDRYVRLYLFLFSLKRFLEQISSSINFFIYMKYYEKFRSRCTFRLFASFPSFSSSST